MPSNHLILCCPLFLLPSIIPSIRVFSNELALCIWWPKYRIFSMSPSNEYSGLISLRVDWFDLLAVPGTLKSLLQHHSSKASIVWCSAFLPSLWSNSYPHLEWSWPSSFLWVNSKVTFANLCYNCVCVCVCVFKEETVTEQEQIENEKKKQWMRGMKLPVEPQLHSFLVAATRAQIVIFCRTLYQKESVLLAKLSQLSQVGLRWSNLILIHDLQPARTYILKCFISSTTFLGLSTVSNS